MARRETIAVEEVLAEISSGHLPSYLRFCEVRDGISENVPYKKRLFAKDTWWNLKEDTSVNDVKRVMGPLDYVLRDDKPNQVGSFHSWIFVNETSVRRETEKLPKVYPVWSTHVWSEEGVRERKCPGIGKGTNEETIFRTNVGA